MTEFQQSGLETIALQKTGTDHTISELPVLLILPHSRCNCRCLMCDIWNIREVREITRDDLLPHLESFRKLKVKWLVLSGGEPLLHSSLSALCHAVRDLGIRITLLTSGLLLGPRARMIAGSFDDIIVSLDGPPEVHNRIRGIPGAYQKLKSGIAAVRGLRARIPIQARCTIQKENCFAIRPTVQAARELSLDSISFLAVDVTSNAFNRPQSWSPKRQARIRLSQAEIEGMEKDIDLLIEDLGRGLPAGFVVETPEKLRRIPGHFRALLGQVEHEAPLCNAPWVSAVINSDGSVQPCFFHPSFGRMGEKPFIEIINSHQATEFRRQLDVKSNNICRQCVCSLFLPPTEPASS